MSCLYLNHTAPIPGNSDEYIGPLFNINYYSLLACSSFLKLVFFNLLIVLVLFLKSTADEYLSGTLGVLCEVLELSHEVAGASFLALGNGAPDVFSVLAAFTKSSNTDLGLGSLLGGATFVSTVVLGMVILVNKEEFIAVRPEGFGRDVVFLLGAVAWLLLMHSLGWGTTVWNGLFFLFMYVVYVYCVVRASRVKRKSAFGDLPTADLVAQAQARGGGRREFFEEREPLISLETELARVEDANDGLVEPSAAAQLHVIDTYVMPPPLPILPHEQHWDNNNTANNLINFDVEGNESTSQLATTGPWPIRVAKRTLSRCKCRTMWAQGLYWRQLRLRRRAAQFGETSVRDLQDLPYWMQIFRIVQMPLGFLRLLTVPAPETSSWSKDVILMHPPCCTLYLCYIFFGPKFHVLTILLTLASCMFSVCMYFTLHESKPPTSKPARLVIVFVSFFMCVVWIYVVAAEVVALLNSFGVAFGANSTLVGLSVLAWGNSIGDLMGNIAVVRAGYPAMAVAACVAGPVFNMYFGLGLSTLALAWQHYPNTVPVALDRYTLSVSFVLVIVLSTVLILVGLSSFRLNKYAAFVLLFGYGAYAVTVLVVWMYSKNM